jgi:spermidine synthase
MINDNSFFRRTIVRQVLMFLFWISGISVSVAVIVWIRLFKLIIGDSYFIASSVLVTFLIGLAIGNYYFGNKIDQKRNELQTFFWFELAVGIYLIFVLIIFMLLMLFQKAIFPYVEEQVILMKALIFFMVFLLLIPPSLLIGANFPILGRFFIQTSERVSREIGNLYGISAFGAVSGCFLTGFVLLPIFGIKQTLIIAAILSLFNAGIVQFLLNKIEPTIKLETEFYNQQLKHLASVTTTKSIFLKRSTMIGITISGFLSISYLVLWVKILGLVNGNNTYSLYITLTVFFAGLCIGAFFYPRFLERGNLFAKFAIIQIIIGIFGIISVTLIPQVHPLNHNLSRLLSGPNSWSWQILIYFYDSILVFLLPTIFIGMTIPLICKVYLTNFEERGKTIGRIYAANLSGAAGGIIVTTFLLVPYVGIQKSITFLALINFLIGLVILFLSALKYGKIVKTSMVFGFVVVIFGLSLLIPSNIIFKFFENQQVGSKVIYVKEGINTTIAIYQPLSQNQLSLASNGIVIAGTTKEWLTTQRFYGHLPLLIHPVPDTILTIGFRDGETLNSIFFHRVKWVDCIDDKSGIVAASELMNGNRYKLDSNPNLHIIPMAGKFYVSFSKKSYDVIMSDVVHPAFCGNASLFTREFFQACRKNLKPGGIMTSVIPLFKISIEDFKVIINTFHSVFPITTIWYPNIYISQYAFLLGSTDPEFKINYKQVSNRINDPGIMVNLAEIGMENVYEILDSFIMGTKIAQELTEGVRLNRDNLPHLEFSTPRTADTPLNWNQILQLLANYRESVYPHLNNVDSTLEQREFVRLILDNYYKSTELVFSAMSYELMGEPENSLQIYRQAYMMNRFDRAAKRFLDSYYDPFLIGSPQTPAEYIQNATVYYQKMENDEAINLVNKALELNPNYAPAYFALGINYEILGDLKKAREMYQKTLKLRPNLQQAKDRLDSLALKGSN